MRIVEFKDGSFGIRSGFIFYKYLDLVVPKLWWSRRFKEFKDCKGSLESCLKYKKMYKDIEKQLKDAGTPI